MVCPGQMRRKAPATMSEIKMKWRKVTHEEVGGVTMGKWTVGLSAEEKFFWDTDHGYGFRRTLKHVTDANEKGTESRNKLVNEKMLTCSEMIPVHNIESLREGEVNAFFLLYLEYNIIIYFIFLVIIFWLDKFDVMILSFC